MEKRITLSQPLEDLRKRVFRSLLAIGVISFFILSCHLTPFMYNGIKLYYPTFSPFDNMAAQVTVSMKHHLLPSTVQLIQTAPGQAFFSQFYIAVLLGMVFAMPIIVKEFVGFLAPALHRKEIQIIRNITIPAIVLFTVGGLFSYFFVTPYILDFLYKYGESAGLLTLLNIMDFITFVLQFVLAFGVSFQLPLIMYALTASGLIDPKFWRNNIRYAIIAMVILGAAITPDGSGVTMWFVAGPMIVLYVIGMAVSEKQSKNIATLKS